MRKFMIGFSLFWIWIGCGILSYGFDNNYYIFLHCNSVQWKSRDADTQIVAFNILFGPIGLLTEVTRTGFGLHGVGYNPGCPVKE